MADKTLHDIGINQARKTAVASRETAAAEFFKGWKATLNQAQKKGLWRWQFKQRDPVTYHDTKTAAKVTKTMAALGYQLDWVNRVFEKNDAANPFGEFVYIKELRVWWHSKTETIEALNIAGGAYLEGMPREEINNTRITKTETKNG